MPVQMELKRIIISEIHEQQVIMLREVEGERSFSIMIGIFEATSIDRRVKKMSSPRPLTHDLVANVVEQMGGEISDVYISELRDHTYYAKLRIKNNGELIEVDSRPSDAIALALRVGATIFVDEDVFPKAGKMEVSKEGEPMKADDPEQLREWLQNIKPEDFEKYNKA